MKDPKKYVRDCILQLQPYSTARDEFEGGVDISVWIDANESPYNHGTIYGRYDVDVNRYPDPHQRKLKGLVSKLKGVPADSIFLGGAGSDEAIDLIYRIFCNPGVDNVIAFDPSYGVYSVSAKINDIEYRTVPLGEDFSLPVEALLAATDSHSKVMWVCSPNNPTANAFDRKDILTLCERFDGMVVVDEAYVDFSDKGSMLEYVGTVPNLIVLQTFSKAWGMASLRLGMAFATPEVALLMAMVKYPYNINGPTQTEVARQIERDITAQIAEIRSERARLESELAKLGIVKHIYKSDANFLLVKFGDADAVYQALMERGVLVRNRNKLTGCAGCLRLTVGTPAENDLLIAALTAIDRGCEPSTPRTAGVDWEGGASSPRIARTAHVERRTSETDITVDIDLDQHDKLDKLDKLDSHIDTGLKFFDHMLDQIPHHGGVALRIDCKGDLQVDEHHTMEDVAIALGQAIVEALGDKRGIDRYGFVLPMDECRAMVLLDFGGRDDLVWDVTFTREYVGDTPTEMFKHFFKSLASSMRANIHVVARGENNHHLAEAIFKGFARALRMAVRRDPFSYSLPSSKGML